jgi:hypothetical protein
VSLPPFVNAAYFSATATALFAAAGGVVALIAKTWNKDPVSGARSLTGWGWLATLMIGIGFLLNQYSQFRQGETDTENITRATNTLKLANDTFYDSEQLKIQARKLVDQTHDLLTDMKAVQTTTESIETKTGHVQEDTQQALQSARLIQQTASGTLADVDRGLYEITSAVLSFGLTVDLSPPSLAPYAGELNAYAKSGSARWANPSMIIIPKGIQLGSTPFVTPPPEPQNVLDARLDAGMLLYDNDFEIDIYRATRAVRPENTLASEPGHDQADLILFADDPTHDIENLNDSVLYDVPHHYLRRSLGGTFGGLPMRLIRMNNAVFGLNDLRGALLLFRRTETPENLAAFWHPLFFVLTIDNVVTPTTDRSLLLNIPARALKERRDRRGLPVYWLRLPADLATTRRLYSN